MLPVKSIVFINLFFFCTFGALFLPHLGIYGYLADYSIGPANQWWEAPFSGLGLRYSFSLAIATIAGFILQRHKLRFGFSFMKSQEILILFFLLAIWFSYVSGGQIVGRYTTVDHPAVKFTKVVIFVFLMTHIITDRKKMGGLLWVFVACALILGLQAYNLPRRAYVSGRLEGIGGSDFAEANFFAAYMAAMLPLIGIQLLRSKNWAQRLFCLAAAAFTANTIVLCRSRGALVGIVMGCIAALFMAPRRFRKKIAIGLAIGALGGLYVMDQQFLNRMTSIIVSEEEKRDESAASRFRLWAAGMEMISDHPLGIGIGNWYQTIGSYIPEYAGKDSHNTYVKCIVELGVQGIFLFGLTIILSFYETRSMRMLLWELPDNIQNDFKLISFGLCIAMVIILTCGLTITMIYTETIWILLMLPVCLRRSLENEIIEYRYSIQESDNPEQGSECQTNE